MSRYHTVAVQGVDIFYREAGAADALTVLLLHGFLTSSHMFRDLIPLLANRYRPGNSDIQYALHANYAGNFDRYAGVAGIFQALCAGSARLRERLADHRDQHRHLRPYGFRAGDIGIAGGIIANHQSVMRFSGARYILSPSLIEYASKNALWFVSGTVPRTDSGE